MERGESAKKNFYPGLNCAQSVFMAFCDLTGLDRAAALKISAPRGGGVGRMREVCGCISASVMVIGLLFYDAEHPTTEEKRALYALEQEFAARFKARFGSIVCRELLSGVTEDDSPVAEERTEAYYKKRPCPEFCAEAADMLADFLKEKGKL